MGSQRKERNVVLDWGDVKRKYLEVVGDGKPWGVGKANAKHHTAKGFEADHHHPYKDNGWVGAKPADTLEWVRNGYRADEFLHSAEYVPMAQRNRPTWSEEPEGDLDIGRLYGGYDNPYLIQAEQEHKPGIRVQIEYAFACGVSSSTISQYGAWVAGLLASLETSGYDLVVDVWIPLDGLFQDRGKNHYHGGIRDNVLIRVKRENEVSDFTEWSAMFSPGGYRNLGFCAKLVAGDKIGKKCSSGLGMTLGGQTWGLDYDKEFSVLKVRVDQRGHGMYGGNSFPKDMLNKKGQELGLIPAPVK